MGTLRRYRARAMVLSTGSKRSVNSFMFSFCFEFFRLHSTSDSHSSSDYSTTSYNITVTTKLKWSHTMVCGYIFRGVCRKVEREGCMERFINFSMRIARENFGHIHFCNSDVHVVQRTLKWHRDCCSYVATS